MGTIGNDEIWEEAVAAVLTDRKCSVAYINRKLEVGLNTAFQLVDRMEKLGIISKTNHVGGRTILIPADIAYDFEDDRPYCSACGGQGSFDHGHSIVETCKTCAGYGKIIDHT